MFLSTLIQISALSVSSLLLFFAGSFFTPTFSSPTDITVWMLELDSVGNPVIPHHECQPGDNSYGCTVNSSYGGYPFTSNPVTVQIEGTATNDRYLRDVIPQEMGPAAYHPRALKAQAIAARTYAYYHIQQGSTINNSTQFQVFLPRKYDTLTASQQAIVDNAVQDRFYMSRDFNDDPIFSEFFDDRPDNTLNGGTPYLLSVEDPISSSAYGSTVNGHGHGLSQKGASRWARGNQWYNINSVPGHPWSVAWRDPFQILTHYYTDIHLRDADAGNAILTPDRRWNALKIDNLPTTSVAPGTSHSFELWLQNTGIDDWDAGYYALSYQICQYGICNINTTGSHRQTLSATIQPGEDTGGNSLISINVFFPSQLRGPVTVRFDMTRLSYPWGPVETWFSAGGWSTQNVPLCVDTCAIHIPSIEKRFGAH